MSFLHTLSHAAFSLNESARKNLYVLLPAEVVSEINPPSTQREEWEEEMLGFLTNPINGSELAEADAEEREGFVAFCSILLSKAEPPAQAAGFLYNLPLYLQASVLHRLLTRSSLSCLRGLEGNPRLFIEWIRQLSVDNERWGGQHAGEIMRSGGNRAGMQRLLEELDRLDRPSTLVLQQYLSDFTDLLMLSERDLQLVLSSESNEQVALALQELSADQVDHLLNHVSSRRRRLIFEESERYREALADEVAGARQGIISTARLLQQRHRITTFLPGVYSRGSEGDTQEQEVREEADTKEPVEKRKKEASSPRGKSNPLLWFGAVILSAVSLLWFLFGGNFSSDKSAAEGDSTHGQWVVGERSNKNTQTKVTGGLGRGGTTGQDPATSEPGGIVAVGEYYVEPAQALGESDATGRVLFLRAGEVRAHIKEEDFSIQTPLIRITSPQGAKYFVRVVLDATSLVRVDEAWVEIESVKDPSNRVRLVAGQERTFTHGAWW